MPRNSVIVSGSIALVLFSIGIFVSALPPAAAQEIPAPAPASIVRTEAGSTQSSPTFGGITEQGRGIVSLPADRLRVTIRTFGTVVRPGASSDVSATGDLEKSVVDVMRANGLPDARLETVVLGNVNAGDVFVGSIDKPTHDKVADIEQRIIAKLPASAMPFLRNVNLTGALEVDDCSAAVDRARIAAYTDARRRASALAQAAGSHLGVLLSASENEQTFGCTDQRTNQYLGNGSGDTLDKTSVDVIVSLSATFATHP